MSTSTRMVMVALAVALAVPAAASAESISVPTGVVARPDFALVSGETNAPGVGFAYAKFGWPSVDIGYQYGINEKFDAGIALSLLYGFQGTTNTQFGIGINAPLRTTVLRREKISIQLSITPGFEFYTSTPSVIGLNFPIGGVLGVQVSPELRIAVGVDFNMKLLVYGEGIGAHFLFAPMFGPALEYYVDKRLAISLDTRFGPVIVSGFGSSEFGFRTQVGVSYKM